MNEKMIEEVAARVCAVSGGTWASASKNDRRLYRESALAVLDYLAGKNVVVLTLAEVHQLRDEAAVMRLHLLHCPMGTVALPARRRTA